MNKIIIISILVPLLFSCKDDKKVKSVNQKKNDKVSEYRECIPLTNSLGDKKCKVFIDSVLRVEGEYLGEHKVGVHNNYNSKGNLEYSIEYILVTRDSSYQNQIYKFDNNGDTLIEGSHFYSYSLKSDTVKIFDSLEVTMSLKATFFNDSSEVTFFIEEPIDTSKYRVIVPEVPKGEIKFRTQVTNLGKQTLVGVISDIKKAKEGELTQLKNLLVFIDYFVLE